MNMKVDLEAPLLTVRDVAGYLKVHPDFVRSLCDQNLLQTVSVGVNTRGRMIRIPMSSLQSYLERINAGGAVA